MTLVGGTVDDSLLFMKILGEHADAVELFLMEDAATRVTVDIIGRVVLCVVLTLLGWVIYWLTSLQGRTNECTHHRERVC